MIIGIDTSAVAGNARIDFAKVKAAGAKFAIFKRSQHVREDKCYARDSDAARKVGIVVGGYLFPWCSVRAASPKAQVLANKSSPGEVVPGVDFPMTLDVEGGSNGWADEGRSKKEIVEVLRQFVLELADAYGCPPMIYTSYNQWYGLGLPDAPWATMCPLWIKTAYRLRAGNPVDQVAPKDPHVDYDPLDKRNHERIPSPWATTGWAIQQWQGDAVGFPGVSKHVDMNRFHGVKKGDEDPFVRWVQRRLVTLPDPERGPLEANGIFDDDLDRAVRAFQASTGRTVDGIVGPSTFAGIAWKS